MKRKVSFYVILFEKTIKRRNTNKLCIKTIKVCSTEINVRTQTYLVKQIKTLSQTNHTIFLNLIKISSHSVVDKRSEFKVNFT